MLPAAAGAGGIMHAIPSIITMVKMKMKHAGKIMPVWHSIKTENARCGSWSKEKDS